MILAFIALVIIAAEPGQAGTQVEYIEHVVAPGETLWSVARRYRQGGDIRELVWEIQQASGTSPLIYPGQVLLVPTAGRGGVE